MTHQPASFLPVPSPPPGTVPLHGSCHCRHVRYVLYFAPPPLPVDPDAPSGRATRIYRCNCTVCHKAGLFHLRLGRAPEQFFLLSPTELPADAEQERGREGALDIAANQLPGLADYRTPGGHLLHFPFCPRCGVRCFTYYGAFEACALPPDLPPLPAHISAPAPADGEGAAAQAGGKGPPFALRLAPTQPGGKAYTEGGPERNAYLSVNAGTLEAGQGEAGDLRRWADEGWVVYLDCLEDDEEKAGENRVGKPHVGGCY